MRSLNKTERILKALRQHLAHAGFQSSVISTQRLPDIRHNLEDLLEQGMLDKNYYNEIISRYNMRWDFKPPSSFPDALSIILVAAPQPKIKVAITISSKTYSVVIPPTYMADSDEEALTIISRHLENYGYRACNALLPTKLLAAYTGLALYGKNNITYVEGLGSYFRLKAFFSDAPCISDTWQEPKAMALCTECVACMKKCPTHAIGPDRFLLHGEKCLTFLNEKAGSFPEWVDPAWHNSLIGCTICQDICPANKNHTSWAIHKGEFSEDETRLILKGVSIGQLPPSTFEKLKRLYMVDDYNVLGRNLEVLIRRSKIMQRSKKPKKE